MTTWKVPLSDLVVSEEDIAALLDVYRSGWLSMGPKTIELESAFSNYAGARHAFAVCNGTAALHLICAAAGLGKGDEVIVPSLTFIASVNAIAYTGATPVFADIASVTRPWLSADSVRELITEKTRAVMAVHYGGHAGELLELKELCDEHGLILLEDAAQAAGSRLDGCHLGTFGLAGAFSLFSNKNLAVGEGGFVVTDDDDVADRVRLLRSHGMTTLTWDRHRGHAATYDVVTRGFNYRLDEPRAALGMSRLQRLDDENAKRAELRVRYRRACDELGLDAALPDQAGLQSSHHLFVAIVPSGVDRDEFRRFLSEAGVQTSLHYPPVHQMSLHADSAVRLPVTEEFAAHAVTLPLFGHMREEQFQQVMSTCSEALRQLTV